MDIYTCTYEYICMYIPHSNRIEGETSLTGKFGLARPLYAIC